MLKSASDSRQAHDDSPVILAPHASQAGLARTLALPRARVSSEQAQLSRMVRRGCYVGLPELRAILAVHLTDQVAVDWSNTVVLKGPSGEIEIAEGSRLLRGLTGIDLGPLSGMDDERRQWFLSALAGRLAGTPFARTDVLMQGGSSPVKDAFILRVTLRSATHTLTTHARAALSTWIDFLSHVEWSKERLPLSDYLGMATESIVTVAQHTLPRSALRTLSAGDIILPESTSFRNDGEGLIQLGGLNVRVRYRIPCSLEVIAVEGKVSSEELESSDDDMMDESWDEEPHADNADTGLEEDEDHMQEDAGYEDAEAEEQEEDGEEDEDDEEEMEGEGDEEGSLAPVAAEEESLGVPMAPAQTFEERNAPAELDTVPLTLSFELGKVRMPLGEVRTLGEGTIIQFKGGSPASIAIVSSGRTLGRGEVVDVDGSIGIRITHWGAQ